MGVGRVGQARGWACAAAVCALACASLPARAAEFHIDAFDADAQGWGSGGAVATYRATGGVGGGGFVLVEASNHLAAFTNDLAWRGDFAALGPAQVKVDMMVPLESPPMEMRVVLFGAIPQTDRWTSALANMVPNDGVWRSYTFPLGPDDIVSPNESGPYEEIMGNVTRFMLRHDAGEPSHTLFDTIDGSLGIDNVELASAAPVDVPGDFDGDGDVDGDDLVDPTAGWQTRFGVDLDGNDFLIWQRHLGDPLNAGAASSAPEPSGLAIVLAAAALGTCWTRTQKPRH